MEIIKFDIMSDIDQYFYSQCRRIAKDLEEKIIFKYLKNDKDSYFSARSVFGVQFARILGYVGDVKNKVILDLGCGSRHSGDSSEYVKFEPWLCRFLHELGEKTIGIDLADLSEENFEHYSMDLSRPGSLDIIPNDSIDVIHSSGLLDSKARLLAQANNCDTLEENLLKQVPRVLKGNGLFIYGI